MLTSAIVRTLLLPWLAVLLVACQSTPEIVVERDDSVFLPHIGGTPELMSELGLAEMQALQLVSTNLVSALVQIPEMQPASVTLQVSKPSTAFGNTIIRALEDAGFGIQRVSADQGKNYVTYSKRLSETDAGVVTDYLIAVGSIEVKREYIRNDAGIFPSSLMAVSGTEQVTNIVINDQIFREQGGLGESFISGVEGDSDTVASSGVSTITVNDYDVTPQSKRTQQQLVLAEARQRFYDEDTKRNRVDLQNYEKQRRTVLIFDNTSTRMMGRGNKQAIRLIVRDHKLRDVFVITACTDADGMNEEAQRRAIRVEEEFISHGIAPASVLISPCIRASYRHSSDDSPVAVSVVQYRPRTYSLQ